MKRFILAAFALAVPALAAAAPPLVFTATMDRAKVDVGDKVVATYAATLPPDSNVVVESLVTPAPGAEAPPGGGAVVEYQPLAAPKIEKQKDGSLAYSLSVVLSPFAPGEIVVPGPHLVVVDAATGLKTPVRPPSLTLHVASRLPEGEKPEQLAPKADRAVRIPSRGPWFWGSLALAALLVSALVFWLVKRRRKAAEEAEQAPPPLPPGEEFLATLSRMSREVPSLGDDTRSFYSDLTHALKRYIERRLEQPVLEWTTFETLRRLRDLGYEMPREIGLSELLSNADRVKFGKGRSTRREAEEHLSRARLVHDHLEARMAPPPVARPGAEKTDEKGQKR